MNDSTVNQVLELSGFQSYFSELVIGSESDTTKKVFLDSVDVCHQTSYEKRLAVYRNNVHHSLIQALADTFPVVEELVGNDFFTQMAKEYLHISPPHSAVLLEFGDGFSGFVKSFEPARSLDYLSDVANLEYLWQKAYHAEDAQSVDAEYFASIPAESLYEYSLVCHPSLGLLNSEFAVGSIWQQHQKTDQEDQNNLAELNVYQTEWLAIIRPEYEVQICFVDEPSYRFIEMLRDQVVLGEAIAELSEVFPEWDIGQTLAFAIQNGFFSGVQKR